MRCYAAWNGAMGGIEALDDEQSLIEEFHSFLVPSSYLPGPTEGSLEGSDLDEGFAKEALSELTRKSLDTSQWISVSILGLAFRLPPELLDQLRTGLDQSMRHDLIHVQVEEVESSLILVASMAASQRDESLAASVAHLARRLWIDDKSIRAQVCLTVGSIAAAACEKRADWQTRIVEAANFIGFACNEKSEADDCLVALETMAWSDWRLRIPLARARVALRSLASMS